MRFGKTYIYYSNLSFFGRLGYYIYGMPFIGGFIKFQYFKREINKLNLNFKYVLDAGCGGGDYAFYLAEKYPDIKINALDLNKFSIRQAKELNTVLNFKNINFKIKDLKKIKEQNKYDFIYSIHVVEHIPNNYVALQKIYFSLKPKGIFYLEIPSKYWHKYYFFNLKYFKKYMEFEKKEHVGEQYDLDQIANILQDIGFKLLIKKKGFGFFGKLAWEIDQILMSKNLGKLKAISLPFLKILCYCDILLKNKNGVSIIILAKK